MTSLRGDAGIRKEFCEIPLPKSFAWEAQLTVSGGPEDLAAEHESSIEVQESRAWIGCVIVARQDLL
jgi:hypothetical protein